MPTAQPVAAETTARGGVVSCWIYDQPPSPYCKWIVQFDGDCDRLRQCELCIPGIGLIKSVYTPPGTREPDSTPVDRTLINISESLMTPINDDQTRHFWFQHRNTDLENKELSTYVNDGARTAFEEDRAVMERVQKGMRAPATPSIDLGLDAGAKQFRLILSRLIEAVQEASSPV